MPFGRKKKQHHATTCSLTWLIFTSQDKIQNGRENVKKRKREREERKERRYWVIIKWAIYLQGKWKITRSISIRESLEILLIPKTHDVVSKLPVYRRIFIL